MIKTLKGDILRNLEEQVQFLTDYHKVNQGFAQWGIRIVGQVPTASDLPDASTYEGEYGDAYAVGTEAPYDFYILTRGSNPGWPNYWFPFGEIAIVGPQGPQGPAGEKGIDGQSSKWYTFGESPIGKTGYNNGDMGIVLNPTSTSFGQVYQYTKISDTVGNWIAQANIRGPQGIQGLMGKDGAPGPQGPQGPKGERGDVGGFINIWGILANTEQLPTPASLDNLTVAYLIEHTGGSDAANDHYDLYIQVGETSDSAVWENAGPFNAATLVTVNGEGQNVWDADTKLDKVTTADGKYKAYACTSTGAQYMQHFTDGVVPYAIVSRDGRGIFKLPADKSLYTDSDDAISKGYANDTYLQIPTQSIPGASASVIGVGTDGKTTQRWITNPSYIFPATESNVIPMYREVGKAIINETTAPANTIYVAQPQLPYEAANKAYADAVAAKYRHTVQVSLKNHTYKTDVRLTLSFVSSRSETYDLAAFQAEFVNTTNQPTTFSGSMGETYVGETPEGSVINSQFTCNNGEMFLKWVTITTDGTTSYHENIVNEMFVTSVFAPKKI